MRYGLRVAPDGTVWTTQLMGGRLVRFDPSTEQFSLYDLPTPNSGPRRPDVDGRGRVWIPEYSGGKLAMFDPATGGFEVFPVPTRGALIRHLDIDEANGDVWGSRCSLSLATYWRGVYNHARRSASGRIGLGAVLVWGHGGLRHQTKP